jgi:hypothetical protein
MPRKTEREKWESKKGKLEENREDKEENAEGRSKRKITKR